MKKKILKVALVATFAFLAGYGVYISQKSIDLSALALDNVEALAGETGKNYYKKYYCHGSYDTNYYRCEIRATGESCSGPNKPYPC
ncbi:NVEALA domain-containing protein [Bacteroides graminisolvens]|uniref:NVEALA domain-containing protein n=1 Tax=Bacteroides graminisolvens TaxID=477666 RepID=UPI0029C6058B|nr:NVEALA domain-containing protein [Bacteroides graminisolvens]